MLIPKQSKMAWIIYVMIAFSDTTIAKNCSIQKNNIYASDLIDTSCKAIKLPTIDVEENSEMNLSCTIWGNNKAHPDSLTITGDVIILPSKVMQKAYKFKTNTYCDNTKTFFIKETGKIHAVIRNITFLTKDKPSQVRISCEYNL